AAAYGAFAPYVNTIGGQDELVFDGNSVVFGPKGQMLAHAASFQEELLVCDVDAGPVPFHRPIEKIRHEAEGAARLEPEGSEGMVSTQADAERAPVKPRIETPLDGPAEVYAALGLGTRDYIRKQSFQKASIGLSAGVDSALTADGA